MAIKIPQVKKKFDKAVHDETDKKAKDTVLKFLAGRTSDYVENYDKYGPDLVNLKLLNTSFTEVEIARRWKPTNDRFPFNSAYLLARKDKWKDLDICYWILRDDCKRAIIIFPSSLKKERLTPSPLKNSDEYNYEVPVNETLLIKLD